MAEKLMRFLSSVTLALKLKKKFDIPLLEAEFKQYIRQLGFLLSLLSICWHRNLFLIFQLTLKELFACLLIHFRFRPSACINFIAAVTLILSEKNAMPQNVPEGGKWSEQDGIYTAIFIDCRTENETAKKAAKSNKHSA